MQAETYQLDKEDELIEWKQKAQARKEQEWNNEKREHLQREQQ